MSRGRRIGRLRLKELSASVREQYLLEWSAKQLIGDTQRLPRLTARDLFGNSLPLWVEIGPGSGEYLCHLAAELPKTNFLGIEASRKAAYYLVDQASGMGLDNLFVIKANFNLLKPLLAKEAWEKVMLHFPDPIHKRKDRKHRIFDEVFLGRMAKTLLPGGKISVVSDDQRFFEEMLVLSRKHPAFRFQVAEEQWWPYESEVKSRFQAFWEGKGVTARQFVLVRVG